MQKIKGYQRRNQTLFPVGTKPDYPLIDVGLHNAALSPQQTNRKTYEGKEADKGMNQTVTTPYLKESVSLSLATRQKSIPKATRQQLKKSIRLPH